MAATPQTQTIQTANQLVGLAQQLMSIYQQMVAIDAAWTDIGMANILNALGTVALATDGSMGAVDGAINVAHPINPTLFPAFVHALSANQITSIKTILDTIVTLVNGSAVSAQASARGILNAAVGG